MFEFFESSHVKVVYGFCTHFHVTMTIKRVFFVLFFLFFVLCLSILYDKIQKCPSLHHFYLRFGSYGNKTIPCCSFWVGYRNWCQHCCFCYWHTSESFWLKSTTIFK
ncbi:hypothetical protein EDEG_03890 [Edhazardia aedis USNM 41457]|uniref:Uncharacterized protein n=1 Tax=Edhazardia aedis (strain USNM 41457) TaxID=1003232 RepID=J9D147_EDHAE|nr:hypothetical protein EDEG_03890 [Edhazardia aedis USNM 41457]|eukprot:EJW01546.1 hypothetical protein EDEG_03890 [Edhazardia aedis USNM 41457]